MLQYLLSYNRNKGSIRLALQIVNSNMCVCFDKISPWMDAVWNSWKVVI